MPPAAKRARSAKPAAAASPRDDLRSVLEEARRSLHAHIDATIDGLLLQTSCAPQATESAPDAADSALEVADGALEAAGSGNAVSPAEESLDDKEVAVVTLFNQLRTACNKRLRPIGAVKVIRALRAHGVLCDASAAAAGKESTRDMVKEMSDLRDKYGYFDAILRLQYTLAPVHTVHHTPADGDCFFASMLILAPRRVPATVQEMRDSFQQWLLRTVLTLGQEKIAALTNLLGVTLAELAQDIGKVATAHTHTSDALLALFGVFAAVKIQIMFASGAVHGSSQASVAAAIDFEADMSDWPTVCIAVLGSHFVAILPCTVQSPSAAAPSA